MNSQIQYIKQLTQKALDTADANAVPVQIEKIASKMGLTVVEFNFPNSVSGVLKKDRLVIGVNSQHSPVRRRFTVAHELGHFLLAHDIGKADDIVDDHFDKPMDKEREANIFASQILMPEKVLKEEVKKIGLNLKKLAELFEVSEQAMTIRLLELNLIK